MKASDYEIPEFGIWSDEVREKLLAAAAQLRRLKPGTAPELDEPGTLYTGPFDTWSGTVEEVMTELESWVRRAGEQCAGLVGDPALGYVGSRFMLIEDMKSIEIWSSLRGDGVRIIGHMPTATATLVRRGKAAFQLWATGEEGFARLKADALRMATSPLEDLLALGEVILLEPEGSFRTEGLPGATYYQENTPTPRKVK